MSVEILSPPGKEALSSYKKGLRVSEQTGDEIPELFLDAMAIREEVFVDEQNCSLENELDDDDARSFHWVVYVSVASSHHTSKEVTSARERKDSADASAIRKPVGTIRLVPPPHAQHPGDNGFQPSPAYHEPYIKLTRLALLKEYRGKYGLSRMLLAGALNFAIENPTLISPPPTPSRLEQMRLEGKNEDADEQWKGLVLVHAQEQAKGYYEKIGFVLDEGLGRFDEEGIMHVGMWRRIPLKA